MRLLVGQQLNLFYIALGFFTRLPVPASLDFSQQHLNRASRYFTLVGWLIGALCALVFYTTEQMLTTELAVLLSMSAGFLITGGFHEDGLADTADGLGGGWEPEQKLAIMKDSRLGSYGALAIWFCLTVKFVALTQLNQQVLAILVAHPLSRMMSTVLIFFMPYVTADEQTKVKPLAESQRPLDLIISCLLGSLGLLWILPDAFMILVALGVVTLAFAWFLKRQIGGFTGDTLGATQQINELTIYLMLIVTGAGL